MDYPSNSQAQPPKPSAPKPAEKKIERVTQSEPVRRKKSLGKRFAETFGGGDARSVGSYVVLDVLVPAAKDMINDAFQTAVERLLFPEGRSRRARDYRSSGPGGYVAYNRYAPTRPYRSEREEPRSISRRARTTHDFDEIILGTRVEAEEVIERLFDLVDRYEQASVADLYELVGINADHTDDKWGWTDVRGSRVDRTRNGYLLNLPKPEPLER